MMHDNSPEGYDILGTTNGLPQITWLRCKGCRVLVAGRDEVEHREWCDRVTAMLARFGGEPNPSFADGLVANSLAAWHAQWTPEQLHERFAHPDFEYATVEGQRKAFDSSVPPETDDPGRPWEPNTAAGRNGWDRFDYTEESYWRRPKAGDRDA